MKIFKECSLFLTLHRSSNDYDVLLEVPTMFESWCLVAKSCPALCNPMNCSPPGSSIRGIFQAGILEWVAISFSRGSSQCRDQTCISYLARRILFHWATWEALWEACIIPLIATTLWERHYGLRFTDEKAEYQRMVVRRQNSNPGPTPKSVTVPMSVVCKVGSAYPRGTERQTTGAQRKTRSFHFT